MTHPLLTRGARYAAGIALAGIALTGGGIIIPRVPVPPTATVPPFTAPPTINLPATGPTASSPINSAEAWALCRIAAMPLFPAGAWQPADFTSASSAPVGSAGSWQVRVSFSSTQGLPGAAVDCTVTGTLGAPIVTTKGPIDFG